MGIGCVRARERGYVSIQRAFPAGMDEAVGKGGRQELHTLGLLLGHLGTSARAVEVVANATGGREAEEGGHA